MARSDDVFVSRGSKLFSFKNSGSKKIDIGKNDKVSDTEKSKKKSKKELEKLAKKSRFKIFHAQSIFPFNFFPDSITIYTNKINVVHRDMLSFQNFPILIGDIKTSIDSGGIIYATLNVEVVGYEQNPPPIKRLSPQDAATARKYILALLEAHREGIDFEYLSKEECIKYLDEIGDALTVR